MGDWETNPRCLKITEKVSFNIGSEASYGYKNLKLVVEQCYQTSHF